MTWRHYVVADVFTDTALEGNPVAVFTDSAGLDSETMQRTARELNLSETVFVVDGAGGGADVRARIFTPATELPFAGHPVLGTAFVVGQGSAAETVRIATGAGIVPVRLTRRDETVVYGEMEQPIPTWEPLNGAEAVLAALGVAASTLPVEIYDNGPRHVFVTLSSEDEVAALAPDMIALAREGDFGVSCCAVAGARVRTRVFCPGLGVDEDPATGSAAGPLAVHLARHGVTAFGQSLQISQGAEIGRPSRLIAVAEGSAHRVTRVAVGGAAVIVAEGRYRLDSR